MKRTLIVATTSWAGMGPYVSEIVNTFSPKDGVYFLLHDYEDDFYRKNVKEDLLPNCIFHKKANSNWNKLKNLFLFDSEFYNLIIETCKKYNIEQVHSINHPVHKSVAKRLHREGYVTIGTVHDLHPHEARKAPHKMFRHWLYNRQDLGGMAFNDALVTNSMLQYAELQQMFPNGNVYFHAFPSLVTPIIKEGKMVPEELKNLDKPYILFFGRIEEYKGLKYLYDAFVSNSQLSENYCLVIAGKGEISFERNANEKNMIWMSRYIDDKEVKYLYENAKCVVYPYINATQSGVLSLAFFFQTPVLASDVPFFKSSIEPSGAGLTFRVGDTTHLTEQLLRLLNSDLQTIKNAELDYYNSFYIGESIHDKLIEIYSNL